MTMVFTFIRLMVSPRLYWVHSKNEGGSLAVGSPYVQNSLESYGQTICTWLKTALEVGLYTSPLWIWMFQNRLLALRTNPRLVRDILMGLSAVYFLGLLLRAYGRFLNPVYREFESVWRKTNQQNVADLRRYDFDFSAWPRQFNATPNSRLKFLPNPSPGGIIEWFYRIPAYLLINSFGLKLIYPGSTRWLFQNIVGQAITSQRANLVSEQKGERVKLTTEDGNDVDAMFFDRRKEVQQPNGSTLVIVCEGNAGFYELGMLAVPLEKGFSVIGWNHPGFWGSTGSPFPQQDARAADAVMQYAIKQGFPTEKVVVYGWSIGGFTTSWLAMNYPKISAVILDATFDNVLKLAVARMPACLERVVASAIQNYVNLNVGDQIVEYNGPLRFIRRSKDEIINTDDLNLPSSNSGNSLIYKVLKKRYPNLFSGEEQKAEFDAYMALVKAGQERHFKERVPDSEKLLKELESASKAGSYPRQIGVGFDDDKKTRMMLVVVGEYLTEFDASHVQPLQPALFQLPSSKL